TGAQTNDSGDFQVVVANSYRAVTSSVASLIMLAPIQIVSQPISKSVLMGSNITFAVAATGTVAGYQWFRNGIPLADDARIAGSSSPTLTILNAQTSEIGG